MHLLAAATAGFGHKRALGDRASARTLPGNLAQAVSRARPASHFHERTFAAAVRDEAAHLRVLKDAQLRNPRGEEHVTQPLHARRDVRMRRGRYSPQEGLGVERGHSSDVLRWMAGSVRLCRLAGGPGGRSRLQLRPTSRSAESPTPGGARDSRRAAWTCDCTHFACAVSMQTCMHVPCPLEGGGGDRRWGRHAHVHVHVTCARAC